MLSLASLPERNLRRDRVTTPRRQRRRELLRRVGWIEPLEARQLLARDFMEAVANDAFPGQAVQHFAPAEVGVVDSRLANGSITNGDSDFHNIRAAVAGDVVVTLTHRGGDPSGDGVVEDDLVLQQLDSGGAPIGAPMTVTGNAQAVRLTLPAAAAGNQFWFVIRGATANDDANYSLSLQTVDREDDGGTNNNTQATATMLGTDGSFAAGVLNDYTITSPDRDYFQFQDPANSPGELAVTVAMPTGSGAPTGVDGPTNLGIRIRTAAGQIIGSSNTTTTENDVARIIVPNSGAPLTYFAEVYSGSLGQVNSYDLQFNLTPVPTGTLSGFKFNDLNGDGLWDENEPGVQGVTVFLDLDNDGTLDGGEPTSITDASGLYTFNNVAQGAYHIREVLPANTTQTWPGPAGGFEYFVDVNPLNLTLDHLDFGNFELVDISGQKFNDLDADGVKDVGEPGLMGWRIFVDLDNDGVRDAGEPFDDTDGSGNYTINGLGPGVYRLREVNQVGWTQSTPNPAPITAISGVNVSGVDFGNFQVGTITGQKFNDLDGDGVKDGGEPGLMNWTIFLDTNNNGIHDGGDVSTMTDAAGNYVFTNLQPGAYNVREVQQGGWTQTTANPATINLTSGAMIANVDFGNFELVDISGQKFNDLDGDGVKDAGELGISGWTIFIDTNNNGVLDGGEVSAVTNAAGNYTIANVGPGSYLVREVQQAGWTQSTANPAAIVTASGVDVANVNFGNYQLGSISGRKFNDLNGNGTDNGGADPGIVNWTIFLDTNNNGVLDGGEVSQLTAANGSYTFANLAPGSYTVREVQQAGWMQTTANPTPINVTSGAAIANVDFGNFRLITISGQKF
ncbi:MAG: hypothetical protein KDA59_26100, partial [Planctomycetales bacterium]|nr:hypothetical protein [Planctomycetales bacterium]